MTAQQQKDIKEYLSKNLRLDYEITPDIYGIHPDQVVIKLLFEGEVIDQVIMYDLTGY
jgi:hypothetical protein